MKKQAIRITLFLSCIPLLSCLILSFFPIIEYPPLSFNLYWMIFIYLSPSLFFGLMLLFSNSKRKSPGLRAHSGQALFSKRGLYALSLLSLVYVAVSIYRYIIIGSVLESGITGARYSEIAAASRGAASGGGIFTAMSLYLSGAPALLLLAVVDLLRRGHLISRTFFVIVIAGFFAGFLGGGRNIFLINTVFCIIFSVIFFRSDISNPSSHNAQGTPRRIRHALKRLRRTKRMVKLALVAFILLSVSFFVTRSFLRSDDLLLRLMIFAKEYDVEIYLPSFESELLIYIYVVVFFMFFYFTSAFSFADMYLGGENSFDLLRGGYIFYTQYLTVERLTGWNIAPDLSLQLLVNGAYYTLPGTIFIDFGIFGVFVFSFFLHFLTVLVLSHALRGGLCSKVIAVYLLTVLALAPLYAVPSIGSGPSLMVLVVILSIKSTRHSR